MKALAGQDFSDPRVILVRGADECCARFWDEGTVRLTQDHDGPTHVIVGRLAPDEKLQKLADKFGYSLSELKKFRDGELSDAPNAAARAPRKPPAAKARG